MKVSAQYAQEHFAHILTAIDTGEEVELTRVGQPSVRLLIVKPLPEFKPAFGKRILGAGRGEMRIPSEDENSPPETGSMRADLQKAVRHVKLGAYPKHHQVAKTSVFR